MRLRTSMLLGCAWLGQGSLQPAMDAWSEFAAEIWILLRSRRRLVRRN